MTASIWAPGSTNVPSVDPASQLLSQSFVATEGQTDFVITQFTYSINSGALTIYVNRAKLDHQYVTELNTTTFRIPACEVGDDVEVVGNVAIDDPSLYADAAAASAAEALGYKNQAEGFKNSAQASAVAAASSESSAAANANAAATSESNVLTYKNAAETAKNTAVSAKDTAVTASNTAVAAASDPNVVVVGQDLLEPVSEIETVASNIGNVNVVGANITNVNAVGGNIANVNTVATNIASVNTVGSNITAVNAVGNSITEVNTCSTNIAAIIDAPNQAASAAASAAAAAASYDNFDDRYLGSKATPPTLDNDGNPLVIGALYYNNGTVVPADKGMYVWEGTTWIPASAASSAILTVYKYIATAGQTSFSGVDTQSLTLVYTVGSVLVSQNGSWITGGSDFAATTGSSIVLTSGAIAGDEIAIYAFATFDIANTYTQAQADARFAHLTGAESIAGVKTFTSRPLFSAGIDLNSNGQIKFPATQNASSDANTLDDYEEGTFTPFMYGTTTAGTGTYSRQVGTYTKIGKSVSFTLIITWSAHTGTGNLRLGGMPFSTANTSSGYTTYSIQPSTLALIAGYYATAYQDPGDAGMGIYQVATGGSSVSPVNMGTSAEVLISGIFLTA